MSHRRPLVGGGGRAGGRGGPGAAAGRRRAGRGAGRRRLPRRPGPRDGDVPRRAAAAAEEGAVTVANPCLSGGSVEIFLEPRVPAPRLLVVGDSPIAEALGRARPAARFRRRARVRGGRRSPHADDAALVVASHGRGRGAGADGGAAARRPVRRADRQPDPRRRGARRARRRPTTSAARVHSPAGLDIGGRTAAEIALSVLAEIVAGAAGGRAARARPGAGERAVDPVCGMTVAAVDSSPHVDRRRRRRRGSAARAAGRPSSPTRPGMPPPDLPPEAAASA